jgi:ABC-type polysaccharide/polyol phosphate export permease
MTNETIAVVKPFAAALIVAVVFAVLMRSEYRKAVKTVLGAVLVWLGLRD